MYDQRIVIKGYQQQQQKTVYIMQTGRKLITKMSVDDLQSSSDIRNAIIRHKSNHSHNIIYYCVTMTREL